MPVTTPMPTKSPGDVLTSTLWNSYLRDNLDKLLTRGHRTLTVAQFAALTAPEGTKGVVAGDEVYLEVDATNGILWHLVYESTETTYKWRCIGGPGLRATGNANTVINTATQVGATGFYYISPMNVIAPRGGDYEIVGALDFFVNGGAAGSVQAAVFAGSIKSATLMQAPLVPASHTDVTVPLADSMTAVAASAAIGICGTGSVPGTYKLAFASVLVRPARLI